MPYSGNAYDPEDVRKIRIVTTMRESPAVILYLRLVGQRADLIYVAI